MKKTILGIAALVAAAALTLTACSGGGGNNATGGSAAPAPDKLSIGTAFGLTAWEIGASGSGFNAPFYSAVYSSLVQVNEKAQPYGELATKIDTSSDGLTYTFHLRSGVTFDDGSTFNADTAVANVQYLEKGSFTGPAYMGVASVAKVDDSTMTITLKQPDPGFLYNLGLGNSYMVSAKALADPKYNQSTVPLGASGPYTFDASKSTAGQDYIFTKNDKAWNAKAFPWKTLELHVIANTTAMSNAMATGAINVEFASWSKKLQADAQRNNWSLTSVMSGWSGLMIADRAGAKLKPLGDVKVRQAMNMAFDRAGIAKAGGADPKTVLTNQVFSTVIPSLNDLYPHDVAKAKQLLAEAGYPNGFTLDLPSMSFFSSTAATVKQALGDIGITVNVKDLDPATYNQQVFAGNFPIYMAFLQLYGNPTRTISDFFQPGPSNPFNSAADVPELQAQLTKLHTVGADVNAIADSINTYATKNAWFVVWNHGASYYVTVPGVSVRPVQGLYIPPLQQFAPPAGN